MSFGGEAVAHAGGDLGHRFEGVDELEIKVGPDARRVHGVEIALDQPRPQLWAGEIVEMSEGGRGHGEREASESRAAGEASAAVEGRT